MVGRIGYNGGMGKVKMTTRPAITIGDCEAAVWRLCAVVYRDKKMARIEMAKVVGTIEQFALSCGADPVMVSRGLVPGLPVRRVWDGGEVAPRPEPRIHLGDQGEVAVCKASGSGVSITTVRDDVTCGNCKRWMKSQDRIAAMPLPELAAEVETSQRLHLEPPASPPGKRVCTTCTLEKDLEDHFARDSKNALGRKTVCRKCDNARRRAQSAAKRTAA